jgi:cathepsin D
MSFWLTRYLNDGNAQVTEPGGVLTLGGTNTSLYTGDIQFLDMPNSAMPSYWLLSLKSVCGCRISLMAETYYIARARRDSTG